MVRKVAFTMIPVKDLARATAFYGEVLGLPLGKFPPTSPWVEYDLPEGGCIAITTVTGTPSASAGATVALEGVGPRRAGGAAAGAGRPAPRRLREGPALPDAPGGGPGRERAAAAPAGPGVAPGVVPPEPPRTHHPATGAPPTQRRPSPPARSPAFARSRAPGPDAHGPGTLHRRGLRSADVALGGAPVARDPEGLLLGVQLPLIPPRDHPPPPPRAIPPGHVPAVHRRRRRRPPPRHPRGRRGRGVRHRRRRPRRGHRRHHHLPRHRGSASPRCSTGPAPARPSCTTTPPATSARRRPTCSSPTCTARTASAS
jgi:catechol 2,3-dioxygenase-like lactoylglutathione lyase family enzyme